MWIRYLWPFIGFLVALGFQVSDYKNIQLAYVLWGLAGIIFLVGFRSQITTLIGWWQDKQDDTKLAEPQAELICPGGAPYWDDPPGYQIRRVGVKNRSQRDLLNVNVWLEDIKPWNHNLGAVRLREKDDIPKSSKHKFRENVTIAPGDIKYFDVMEKHFNNSELLLCYADCTSPALLPLPRGHFIITLKITAANLVVRRNFFFRVNENGKLNLEPFGSHF